jgi:hypothetical protein
MNPTGNTTADMIFTGSMLVLHLAALAGLGYLLGRLRANRWAKEGDAALDKVKLLVEELNRQGQAHSEARQRFKDQIAAAHAARNGMADGYRDEIRNLSAQLAQSQADRNTWHDRALALMEVEDAAYDYRFGIIQREEDEREWCAAGQTVSAAELAERAARLDKAMEGRSL